MLFVNPIDRTSGKGNAVQSYLRGYKDSMNLSINGFVRSTVVALLVDEDVW